MLAGALQREIYETKADDTVTAVLNVIVQGAAEESRAALNERITSAKRPLLEAVATMDGVRLNSLVGMPQAIAMAPASSWRDLLKRNPWLASSPDYWLEANVALAPQEPES